MIGRHERRQLPGRGVVGSRAIRGVGGVLGEGLDDIQFPLLARLCYTMSIFPPLPNFFFFLRLFACTLCTTSNEMDG